MTEVRKTFRTLLIGLLGHFKAKWNEQSNQTESGPAEGPDGCMGGLFFRCHSPLSKLFPLTGLSVKEENSRLLDCFLDQIERRHDEEANDPGPRFCRSAFALRADLRQQGRKGEEGSRHI